MTYCSYTHLATTKQSNWVQPPAAPENLPTTKGGSTKLNLSLINFFSKEVKFTDGKERQKAAIDQYC